MTDPRRITLEIDTSGPPIGGRLLTTPDAVRPFVGWTSLLAALDAIICPAPDEPRPESPNS